MAHFDIGQSSGKGVTGIFNASASEKTKVTLGFKPSRIFIAQCASESAKYTTINIYDANYNPDVVIINASTSTSGYGNGLQERNIGSSDIGVLYSIDDDGFTMNAIQSNRLYCRYFAMP